MNDEYNLDRVETCTEEKVKLNYVVIHEEEREERLSYYRRTILQKYNK